MKKRCLKSRSKRDYTYKIYGICKMQYRYAMHRPNKNLSTYTEKHAFTQISLKHHLEGTTSQVIGGRRLS